MLKKKVIGCIATGAVAAIAITAKVMANKAKKTTYVAEAVDPILPREMGIYEKYIKRGIDVVCATGAIVVFSPLYLGVSLLVKTKLGSPVLFTQDRPGLIGPDGKETVFKMYKFRSMTDERDENGDLLPDDVRLTKFGKWLRNTSLDELPEAFNILNGTMSVIGPRPQLVRDMVFMNDEQRMRHTAKPGLSGLAQVNGRNAISWEDKINWDLKYINEVSFKGDLKIIFNTVKKAFIKQEGITQDDMATAEDFGDFLLRTEKVNELEYAEKQKKAKDILSRVFEVKNKEIIDKPRISAENYSFRFSVSMCVYKGDNPEWFDISLNSVIEQTLKPTEIVLVVDGAISASLHQVINKYQNVCEKSNIFFNVIYLEKNQGHGNARRIGLEKCQYDLVALMDADDISAPERFEKQISVFKKDWTISAVGGNISEFIDTTNDIVGKRIVPECDIDIKQYIKKRCPMNQVTVMFNKSDVNSVGGYIDWYCEEDYYLWIRLAMAEKKFYNIQDNLVNVRVGKKMYQRRGGLKYFRSEERLQRYMLKNKMIGPNTYIINVTERFIVQVVLPNKIRGWVFQKFAREI